MNVDLLNPMYLNMYTTVGCEVWQCMFLSTRLNLILEQMLLPLTYFNSYKPTSRKNPSSCSDLEIRHCEHYCTSESPKTSKQNTDVQFEGSSQFTVTRDYHLEAQALPIIRPSILDQPSPEIISGPLLACS